MPLFKPLKPMPHQDIVEESVFSPTYDVSVQFRIRRISSGNFKNLWALDLMDVDGGVEAVICDADSLGSVIDHMNTIFEDRGY
jgi:hypothetical protein